MAMFVAGVCGAVASILGKIALAPSFPALVRMSESVSIATGFEESITRVAFRLVVFGLMLYFNAVMLANFLRALEKRGSLPVTVICSATNFICTGLLSRLILDEDVNGTWFMGATVIVFGIALVLKSSKA